MPNQKQFKTHEDYLSWYRNYRKDNREKIRENSRKWRIENNYSWDREHKLEAMVHNMVWRMTKRGEIKKQPCKMCNDNKSEAHHPDYNKPKKIIWLCKIHHKAIHKKLKNKN